jgi:hypothetical protein
MERFSATIQVVFLDGFCWRISMNYFNISLLGATRRLCDSGKVMVFFA